MRLERFVTVDIILQTQEGILLVKRGSDPFKGRWALPGGIVEEDETVEQAAMREAREETGLKIASLKLVGVYSKPGRDPRGRSITVAYAAKAMGGRPRSGSDAAALSAFPPADLPRDLAFDHASILKDYLSLKARDLV